MEHMGGRNVVQARLSSGELHKVVQRKVGYMESGKREGGAMAQLCLTWA
jgi:hypothetical protein